MGGRRVPNTFFHSVFHLKEDCLSTLQFFLAVQKKLRAGGYVRAKQHLISDNNILVVLATCFVPLFSLLVRDETSFALSFSGTVRVYLCHRFLAEFYSPFRHFVLWRVFPPRILTHVFVSLSL